MYLVEQQRNATQLNNEEDKKKRVSNDEKRFPITNFEAMSNELLYEIFEFVDIYDLYEAFSNLNTRFQDLIIYSSFPLKIKLSFTCKSLFLHRFKHIVTPNIHRIVSLRTSHYLSNNLFTLFTFDSSFVRLESLILNSCKTDKLVEVLTSLTSLPRLFSLSISVSADGEIVEDAGYLYRLIFRLPVLKYGKFSFSMCGTSPDLSITDNEQQEYSPIEYLVIDGYCRIHQFNALLSYVPRLRHFSCDNLSSIQSTQIEVSIVPLYLTHLSIKECFLSFDEFELFIVKICAQLKSLHISDRRDIAYLDANRWQRLISRHMHHLSTFNFEHMTWIEDQQEYHAMTDQFLSAFWIERRWFFAHQHYLNSHRVEFYSTQPYRRIHYDFHEQTDDNICLCRDTGLNLAQNIRIEGHHLVPNSSIQFARATLVNIQNFCAENIDQFIINLNLGIPLTQIRQLYLSYIKLDTGMLIEILCCMVNLDLLDIYYRPLQHTSIWSDRQEAQIVHLVSKNKITKVIIGGAQINTYEDLQLLIKLCPRIQYFEIAIEEDSLEYIAQLMLSKYSNSSSHLFSLLIWNAEYEMVKKLRTMIGHDKILHDDYTFDYHDGFLKLWW